MVSQHKRGVGSGFEMGNSYQYTTKCHGHNTKILGFDGDGVADLKNHGGQDKAVYVFSLDHYPCWGELLGTKLNPPAFGENLSVSHLKEDDVCLGDTFQLGTAVVQISQPRQPCKTLAALYGRNDLGK